MTTQISKINSENSLVYASAREIVEKHWDNDLSLLPTALKCLFHDGVVRSLGKACMLDHMVFHGGTCLQRVYGSPRLSEDLDFCVAREFSLQSEFNNFCKDLETALREDLAKFYHVDQEDIFLRSPKQFAEKPNPGDVFTWKLGIVVKLGSARQVIKIDLENRPCLTAEMNKFPSFAAGTLSIPDDLFLNTQGIREIMANKFVSIFLRNRLQYRDCFDLAYFTNHSDDIDKELLIVKIQSRSKYEEFVRIMHERLPLFANKEQFLADFKTEMSRFLSKSKLPLLLNDKLYAHLLQLVENTARYVDQAKA